MKHNLLLAFSFAKRDFKERYVGTGLGKFWFILSPIITIFIYTVIFSDFMKMKTNIVDSTYAYSIYLIPGLLAWTSFSSIIVKLNNSILEQTNLIKKISVPVYVYQLSTIITEFFILLLSFGLSLMFLLMIHYPIGVNFLYLLPILFLQTIFAFSIGVILSLFTPFFKDLKEAIPVIIQLWFWVTPIIYMKNMIENKYPFILYYNPFFHFVTVYQDIFLYSKAPSYEDVLLLICMTLVVLVIAGYLYKKMIPTIKDII